jgi:cytochrome c biogenesis protein CcdA
MTGSLLALGVLLGVKHALEADHVAAVVALATRSASFGERAALGGAWGVGHALTLFSAGAAVLLLGLTVPPALERAFEGGVGVLLALLGVDVLCRLRRERIHFHAHEHGDGPPHLHAHAHVPGEAHGPEAHRHLHVSRAVSRALLVGGAHGLAGSAALVLVSARAAASTGQAFANLAAFSIGAVVGMSALSVAIALPIRATAPHLAPLARGLQAALGVGSVAFGLWIAIGAAMGAPPGAPGAG